MQVVKNCGCGEASTSLQIPPEESSMLMLELFSANQKIDLNCWQLMLPALFGVSEQETVWDIANRIVDRYSHVNALESEH